MVIVAAILAIAFVVVCVVDYNQSVAEVYAELESSLMVAHDGASRDREDIGESAPGMSAAPEAHVERDEGPKGKPFELGAPGHRDPFVPVAVYEIMQAGTLDAVSNMGNAAIPDALLGSIADAVSDMPDGAGELDQFGLFYAKQRFVDRTLIAFADASSASSWQGLALLLAAVGAAVLAVFFVISLLFSRWALSPVRQAWEKQKRFVSDASHELKTPLAVMAANTAIIQRNAENTVASQSRWIESTEAEISAMRELVDDMLFMASADEGAAQVELQEQVNLSRLVEAQLLQLESLAFENRVTIASRIEGDIVVMGVRAQLDRLVRTLLDNAFKYTPSGGEVEVCLSRIVQERPQLTVRNTGEPIPPDELSHVFDRFYRADEARTRGTGGYGLGLSIAHDIAQVHGADLSVTSDADTGTAFTVTWC